MKKAFVTGITGTVAPYLKEELIKNGYQVFDNHFRIESDQDLIELSDYLNHNKPDYIYHLALGPKSYIETLIEYCEKFDKTLIYVSTVSVFEDNGGGPYAKDTVVKVSNDYGKYKYECETLIKKSNCRHYIIRIGWQISDKGDTSSNNMFNFIQNNTNKQNEITVSDGFYPSTSFLNDTAKALFDIVDTKEPDLYLVNSNHDKSLYEIVSMLNEKFNIGITVKPDSSFKRNDVMVDQRVTIKKL